MAKIVAIANQKGGVGKTFTSNSLAVGLKRKGKKVLAIDGDSQANLTFMFGLTPDDVIYSLAHVIISEIRDYDYDIHEAIIHTNEGVDLIPSSIEMASMELEIMNAQQREFIMSNILRQIEDEYDYIILDCPPALGLLTINMLVAANGVIIPANANAFSTKGMQLLFQSIAKLRGNEKKSYKRGLNPDLEIIGIVFTMVRTQTTINKDFMASVREEYGSIINIFDSFIPLSSSAEEAVIEQKSIYVYAKNNPVAKSYEAFVTEFLEEVE